MKPFIVYMLRCRDGSYYVGHTDDLEKRMAEHVEGTYGGHTSRKRPLKLVWTAEVDTRDEALAREWQLKKWTRAKKDALVAEDWGRLNELARGPDRSERLRRFGVLPPNCAGLLGPVRLEPAGSGTPVPPEPFGSAASGSYGQSRLRADGREETVRPEPFGSAASGGYAQGRLRAEGAESKAAASFAVPFDSGPGHSNERAPDVEREQPGPYAQGERVVDQPRTLSQYPGGRSDA